MAGRAPLLLAAALFSLGAAGLLATLPGQDASRAFIPFLRPESHSSPAPELLSAAPGMSPVLEFPGVTQTAAAAAASRPTISGAVLDATPPPPLAPKPTPTPPPPPLVIAAVASDPEETPTQGPLRIGMIGSDSEPSPSPTATASATPTGTASAEAIETPTPANSAD
jgi:hypothetical protein